jgi:hypothetical protein
MPAQLDFDTVAASESFEGTPRQLGELALTVQKGVRIEQVRLLKEAKGNAYVAR